MKTPLHIVTGFLGVGKTTAIRHLVGLLPDQGPVAVVVNERGQVGLDGAVLAAEQPGLEIREVAGGCVCCTAGPALDQALAELMDRVKPIRIFLEPSGAARPGDVVELCRAHRVGPGLDLKPVIGLVDPMRFLQPRMMSLPVYRDQVEAADILAANRSDLADEAQLAAFREKAQALYPPKAMVLTVSQGRLPPEVLHMSREQARQKTRPVIPLLDGPDSADGAVHGGLSEAGWRWPPEARFRARALEKTLKGFSGVERAKGVFHTDQGWLLLELVGEEFHRRETQFRLDSRCQFFLREGAATTPQRMEESLQDCLVNA